MSQQIQETCIQCKRPWNEVPRAHRVRAFKDFKKGEPLPRCEGCQIKSNHTESRKKRQREDMDDPDTSPTPQELSGKAELQKALDDLASQPSWTSFEAILSDFQEDGELQKTCAARILAIVADCTSYKFSYHDTRIHSSSSVTIRHICLQSDSIHQEPKKPCIEPKKARDARRMQRFPCNGRLNITWKENSKTIKISITHKACHAAYGIPPRRTIGDATSSTESTSEGSPRNATATVASEVLEDTRKDIQAELTELKTLLADLLEILESQGPDIDPRFLATFETCLKDAKEFLDAVHKVKNGGIVPGYLGEVLSTCRFEYNSLV